MQFIRNNVNHECKKPGSFSEAGLWNIKGVIVSQKSSNFCASRSDPAILSGDAEEVFCVAHVAAHWGSTFAEHIATTPDGFDEVLAFGGVGQLFAELTDKHVDDFEFGFVHAAIKMVEEHFLGERGALSEAEQL